MSVIIERQPLIDAIRRFPAELEALVCDLSNEQLTTPFLAGEWNIAQNVHHLADSHMTSYLRCKLIATEDRPTLKPYDQDLWAALPDGQSAEIGESLAILRSLHARWARFWQALPTAAWGRTGMHPEHGEVSLDSILRSYVAHGEAHLDQIRRTLAAQH